VLLVLLQERVLASAEASRRAAKATAVKRDISTGEYRVVCCGRSIMNVSLLDCRNHLRELLDLTYLSMTYMHSLPCDTTESSKFSIISTTWKAKGASIGSQVVLNPGFHL